MRRVFSVLFLVILSIAAARAQEAPVIKPESCLSLFKTSNSFAYHQSELLLAQARFGLHCGSSPRFHAYDQNQCNELETKIAVMKEALSVCKPFVRTSSGANTAVDAGSTAAANSPEPAPILKPKNG